MGNSNSITNEECDAKIRKMVEEGEKTGKKQYINKIKEKKDILFNIFIEGLKSGKFKERLFKRIRDDKGIYITHIRGLVMGGQISVPDNDDPTDQEKEEYISRISDNVNNVTDILISRMDDELNREITDEKKARWKENLDEAMEKILIIIEEDPRPTLPTSDINAGAKLLADIIYLLLLKGDLRKDVFNRHKGVTYNPPYTDGSAGEGGPPKDETEPFVNGVEDEHKFSKILLVLIVVVLVLHLFTDFKIF